MEPPSGSSPPAPRLLAAGGRRSLTPHCLGGVRGLPALCPRNLRSGKRSSLQGKPELYVSAKCNDVSVIKTFSWEEESTAKYSEKYVLPEETLAGELQANLLLTVTLFLKDPLSLSLLSLYERFVLRHLNATLSGTSALRFDDQKLVCR